MNDNNINDNNTLGDINDININRDITKSIQMMRSTIHSE